MNTGLKLTGIVMTMYDPRTKLSEQVVQEVRRYFGDRVYDTIIPRTVRLSEAPGFGQPITVYDPKSRGAQCYRDLAREVVDKLPSDEGLPIIDDLPAIIVPPPEPEPARAPRPLVANEPATEVEEAIDDVASGVDLEPTPAPTGDEDPLEPEELVEDDVEVEPSVPPSVVDSTWGAPDEPALEVEPETDRPRSAAEPRSSSPENGEAIGHLEASVAFRSSEEPAGARTGPPVVVDVEGSAARDPGRHVEEASSGPRAVPAPRLEVGQVIVIDDEKTPEPQRPMPEPEDEDAGDSPRKRWSLFRKGGDR